MDERSIQQWESVSQDALRRRMVRDYIRCNRVNNDCNTSKAKIIIVAQILLLMGLILIPFILGIVFLAFESEAIHLDKPLI
jgi:hypothetical protein